MSEGVLEQKYIQEAFGTKWVVSLRPNVIDEDVEFIVDTKKNAIK